jgi:hypothetical protein
MKSKAVETEEVRGDSSSLQEMTQIRKSINRKFQRPLYKGWLGDQ